MIIRSNLKRVLRGYTCENCIYKVNNRKWCTKTDYKPKENTCGEFLPADIGTFIKNEERT